MTLHRLYQTKNLVREILKEDEASRNSDDRLYCKVCEHHALVTKCPVTPSNTSADTFLAIKSKYKYPPFESVRRARQAVQAECPELKACEKVQAMRFANEEEYKRFALTQDKRNLAIPVRCVNTGEIFASAADAAEAYGLHRSYVAGLCNGHKRPKETSLRFEYYSAIYSNDIHGGASICWHCANAYGGCEWTGRDEFGKLKFEPVPGWEAVETSVSVGGGYRTDSYKVISCPKYVPEKGGKHG